MKIRNIMMALVAIAALLFSGCSKNVDLAGTHWNGVYVSISEQQGEVYTFYITYDMYFTDATNGYFDIRVDYSIGSGSPIEYGSANMPFTWTFDGESEGQIKAHIANTGQEIIDVFQYDKETGEITLYDGGAVVKLTQVK